MTSWIWTSRVKTCAPLKPDLNKNILKITCFAPPNDKTLELSKDRWHFSSCLFSIIRTDLAICQKCNWSLLISMILQNHWNYQGPVTFVVRHEPNYFLTFGLKSRGFKKCSRSTAFMVFAKIFKLAGANALLDVHTTRWIWTSRAKTCASMKPFQNKDVLLKHTLHAPQHVEILNISKDLWHLALAVTTTHSVNASCEHVLRTFSAHMS